MSDANEFPVVWTGILRKMRVEAGDPVAYHLKDATIGSIPVADHALTPHVGGEVHLRFLGEIRCTLCGRATKKTFGDGFCFPCSQSRPEADICIVKPELCHHGQADHPCRDEAFAQSQCFQPHILYVSLTSGVKVGITRRVNLPSRWIDQGAVAAVPLAQLPDRRAVGLIEKRLSDEGYADKTHWTRMLKGDPDVAGLEPFAREVAARLEAWGAPLLPASERAVATFRYPVRAWPEKVTSFNLDKSPAAGGVLQGIKGQYLLFDGGVINLRKYSGYRVEVRAGKPDVQSH
ncbi:MAG: DUF2797 domain-containing protein [bacterium]|nr:DUF2797 domain-containing protein [bacterium]